MPPGRLDIGRRRDGPSSRAERATLHDGRTFNAVRKGEDTIWATYETRYVRERQLLTEEPYLSFIILRRKEDRWRVSARADENRASFCDW